MGAVPQAKTCYYKGVKFRSNLEGKTAEALDNLGIRWEYERQVFRGNYGGGQYTPDFYLPNDHIYFEVVGVWDSDHAEDLCQFFKDANLWDVRETESLYFDGTPAPKNRDVVACITGSFDCIDEGRICAVRAESGSILLSKPLMLCQCGHCGHWSLVPYDGNSEYAPCRHCGLSDPDDTNNGQAWTNCWGITNLFELGGIPYYDARDQRTHGQRR